MANNKKRSAYKSDNAPIIGKVFQFIELLNRVTKNSPNSIKHPYIDSMKNETVILLKQAIRQVNGKKDYQKRVDETIEELHTFIYLLEDLCAITDKDTVKLDVALDNISGRVNMDQDLETTSDFEDND